MKLPLSKIFYAFTSCCFILLLLLPVAVNIFENGTQANNQEQRTLSQIPAIEKDSLLKFPKAFENYYNDNFGLRQALIDLGAKIKYTLFRSSPKPDKVAVGKDGWLFLAGTFYEITQDLSRKNLYTGDGLTAAVNEWEKRKAELLERHINYYKAFWPDKHYIYPEFMPACMTLILKDTLARCDQALNVLRDKKSPVQILDVRTELLKAKQNGLLYYKGDSHWNSYGAFIAYEQLMNLLAKDFKELKPYALRDFTIKGEPGFRGDLSKLIHHEPGETQLIFKNKYQLTPALAMPVDDYPLKTEIYRNDSATSNLKALVYRDSFTTSMIPFLKLHFKEIILIWDTPYTIEFVDKVKPDIVIECYATRYFR